MQLRPLESRDYDTISAVVDSWWAGRPVRQLLPRLFFEHFGPTSFALVDAAAVQGFLVGFRSQTLAHVAYIHFVGIAPEHRGKGLGRRLYVEFFERVSSLGCRQVHCLTAPTNVGSIAFHKRMGFQLVEAGGFDGTVPVSLDHAGPGQHRVLFCRELQDLPAS